MNKLPLQGESTKTKSKYHKYKVHDKTIDEYKILGSLKRLIFDETSFNPKTNKGDRWICQNNHKFRASYTTILHGKFLCPSCVNEEYSCELTLSLITDLITSFFKHIPKISKRDPPSLRKINRYNKRKVDLHIPTQDLAIILQEPQDVNFIKSFHKTEKSFNKLERNLATSKKHCEESEIHLIIIPYHIKTSDILEFLKLELKSGDYHIDTTPDIFNRYKKTMSYKVDPELITFPDPPVTEEVIVIKEDPKINISN